MPRKKRYVGNPVLSRVGRVLRRAPVADVHGGRCGPAKDVVERMDLRTTDRESAAAMLMSTLLACATPTSADT